MLRWHLRSTFSAAAQRLGIMRKSWQVFHARSLLRRYIWSFVLPVLVCCSAVWCSAADTHLKLTDRVVRSVGFLAGGVLECNLAQRRSVAELFMLFKIKSNQMHPFSGALPLPYVPAGVTRGALVAHRHSFAPPCWRTSQYRRSFVPLSVSLWNDLSDPMFDGVGLVGFKSRTNAFLLTWSAPSFLSPTVLSFSSFHGLVVWLGVFGLIECSHSLQALHSRLQIIIIWDM